MSKVFDYIGGRRGGRVAKLEAELEHVMAHCVPGSALDQQRDAVIEECARAVDCLGRDARTGPAFDCAAAAIRALKESE